MSMKIYSGGQDLFTKWLSARKLQKVMVSQHFRGVTSPEGRNPQDWPNFYPVTNDFETTTLLKDTKPQTVLRRKRSPKTAHKELEKRLVIETYFTVPKNSLFLSKLEKKSLPFRDQDHPQITRHQQVHRSAQMSWISWLIIKMLSESCCVPPHGIVNLPENYAKFDPVRLQYLAA